MLHVNTIKISNQMLSLISELDEFKGAWAALENHTTALQLLGDVADYGQNFKAILGPWHDSPLTVDMIKKLHGAITGGQNSTYRSTDFPLVVQQGERIIGTLETASADDINVLMSKLVEWTQNALSEGTLHPLLVIALFSSVFVQISPFEKGNQRLSRLLMTLLMLKAGYTYAPYSSLESVLQSNLQAYFDAMHYTQETLEDETPNWEPWLMYFLNMLKDHKDRLKTRMDQSGKAVAGLPALSAKIMKLFEKQNRWTMKEIEQKTRGKRSTLKLRLKELVDDGYLTRHGKARATWYAKV